jgi:FBP C-terminal treble-clef zinc-finger
MFKLETEQQLRAAFRPKDRGLVELAPEVKLPLLVKHYVAWSHPAGGRVYLVFAIRQGAPTGIAFDVNESGPGVPHLCDWCRCPGVGARVGLLTTRLNANRIVGVHVCTDLSCRNTLEDAADRAGTSVVPAMEALIERMGQFASVGLGIDLSGARR